MQKIVTLKGVFGYVVFVASILVFTNSCSPAPEGLYELHDYQLRVASTLNREPIVYRAQTRLQTPSTRDLRLEVPRLALSLLDSVRLDACSAGALIAERNSSLGRLTNGILKYHYDRQLLDALLLCAQQLQTSQTELAKRVQQQALAKQEIMPLLREQAITSDAAVRSLLSMADRPLAVPDNATLAPLFSALSVVVQTLDNNAELPAEADLVQALEHLEKDRYISQLWRALYDNHNYLLQLKPLVENMSEDAGCLSAGVPERARILRQVFISRFSGPVQKYLNALTNQAQQLKPYLSELHTTLPAWQSHLLQVSTLDDQLKTTTRKHVQYWQQFFRDCEFAPGA